MVYTQIGTRLQLLKLLPKNLVIAELGVFIGDFSEKIMNICQPKFLYLVDSFPKAEIYSGDKDGKNIITVPDLSVYYDILSKKYEVEKVLVRKMYTHEFLTTCEKLDAVYIDADHSYGGVLSDVYNSADVIDKGFILGHDYDQQGIRMAVDQFCRHKGLKIKYLTKDKCPSYFIEV